MDSVELVGLALAATVVSGLAVPIVRRKALALRVLDAPSPRRAHAQPTPRLGGVAIFGTFVLLLAAVGFLGQHLEMGARANPRGVFGFAMGALFVFIAGVMDDVREVKPRVKLLFEILAAIVVVWLGGCQVTALSSPVGPIELGFLSVPLTIVWIVAITNAMNLMDGLDGLAAGVSVIAFGAIAYIGSSSHNSVPILCAILVGSSLGFLLHNFHPASIFMGDSGSLFLGFSLGVLSTYANAKATTGGITAITFLIVGLPLADTVWAVVRRYARGLMPGSLRSHLAAAARIFIPDRKHIHHRLVEAGLGDRLATCVLYGLQALACAVAIYLTVLWSTDDGRTSKPGVPQDVVHAARGPS